MVGSTGRPSDPSSSDEITVKLKATTIVAALLTATAAHAETIYLKCWARGLAGDQLNSVYINEQVTVNLDEKTMHSWTTRKQFDRPRHG
jgi:hypothetical protein